MATRKSTFPRLDLAANHIRELEFAVFTRVTPELKAALMALFAEQPGRFFSIGAYSKRGMELQLQEYAALEDDQVALPFMFIYKGGRKDKRREWSKTFPNPGLLLATLAQQRPEGELSCSVHFVFDAATHETRYPLPTVPHLDDMPFDVIRGIRGARLADDGSGRDLYSFTMDRVEDKIHLLLDFMLASEITAEIPEDVLASAVSIRRVFVRETDAE